MIEKYTGQILSCRELSKLHETIQTLRQKITVKYEEGCYIMMKTSIHQKDRTIKLYKTENIFKTMITVKNNIHELNYQCVKQ